MAQADPNFTVKYRTLEVNGGYISPKDTKDIPEINYDFNRNEKMALYSILMYDPDAVVPTKNYIHFLDVNIPGNNVSNGKIILHYKGPAPPQGSGKHRYIFNLYKQETGFPYREIKDANRAMTLEDLNKIYNLGEPIASRIFISKYVRGGGKNVTKSKKTKMARKTRRVKFT